MKKKLFAACLALAAFAVVPSQASARPVLTQPTATVLGTPTSIVGTNVGVVNLTTAVGTLTCSAAKLTGTLRTNGTVSGFEDEIESAVFGGTGLQAMGEPEPECTGTGLLSGNASVTSTGLPWCLSATLNADQAALHGGRCLGVEGPIGFDLAITGVGNCEYSRSEAVLSTIATDTGGASSIAIAQVAFPKSAGPGMCPAEIKLDVTLSLETDTSPANAINISS